MDMYILEIFGTHYSMLLGVFVAFVLLTEVLNHATYHTHSVL